SFGGYATRLLEGERGMKLVSVLVPLGVVAAVSLGLASSSVRGEAPTATNEVTIRPGDGGCVIASMDGAEVTEVSKVVLPKLGLADRRATTAGIRSALLEHYGSRVSEDSIAMHYVRVW